MGLADNKRRRKIAQDPNNTRWSRKTDTFGHKILRAQGWEPGQYLGAQDASHAEFHTAANASHIRVFLKEDNLGLGAKRNQGDECTGLDAFKDLLGRLNGKSETTLEQEKKAREDAKMNLYMEQKFSRVRFVSGGFLVGDTIPKAQEDSLPEEDTRETDETDILDAVEEKQKKEKKSKKRKAGDEAEKKRRKKEKRSKIEAEANETPDSNQATPTIQDEPSPLEEPQRSKSKHKDKRRKTGDEASRMANDAPEKLLEKVGLKDEGRSTPSSDAEIISGRHFARKRFIAQKRRAMMDPDALKQIFMIKT